MFFALRPVASVAFALAGVLIASWREQAGSDEPEVYGGCPEAAPCPPCLEAGLRGLRAGIHSLLARSDSLLEVIVGVCAACVLYVAGRACSRASRACTRWFCETSSTRRSRRVAGRYAVPTGIKAIGDIPRGSRLLAREVDLVPGDLAQSRSDDGGWR